jgi:hypothetical protein
MLPPTITLPADCGRVTARGLAPGRAVAAVAVCSEVYDNESAERSVQAACAHLVEKLGVRLIAVETADVGFDLTLPRDAAGEAFPPTLSAGVYWFIRTNRRPCRVVGVDDAAARQPAWDARNALDSHDGLREPVFAGLGRLTRRAEERLYPDAIQAACSSAGGGVSLADRVHAAWRGSDPEPPAGAKRSLGDRIHAALAAVRARGLDPGDFPQLSAFEAAAAVEGRLTRPLVDRIEGERETLVRRLVAATTGWTGAAGDAGGPDVPAARRGLRFWATTHRTGRRELEHHMRKQGVGVVLRNCNQWVYDWLVGAAVGARAGELDQADLYHDLVRLALCAEVDVADLRAFREYAAYVRLSRGIDATALELELTDARRALARSCGPAAAALFDLGERLQGLRRALACALTPWDTETALAEPGALAGAAGELAALAGTELPNDFRASVASLDGLLAYSRVYTERNLARGAAMARRATDLLRASRDDRMVIVAGGFHARAITRSLERGRTVSWYAIAPVVKNLDQHGGAYIEKRTDTPP